MLVHRAHARNGLSGIEPRDCRADHRNDAARIARRPYDKRHRGERVLRERLIDLRPWRGGRPKMADVPDETDDGHPWTRRAAAEADPSAEGVLTWPLGLCKRLIDHHDQRYVTIVRCSEVAPRQDRNAHRVEVRRRDDLIPCNRPASVPENRLALDHIG